MVAKKFSQKQITQTQLLRWCSHNYHNFFADMNT